ASIKAFVIVVLLLAVVSSCKKEKKAPTPAKPKTSMTAKIDGNDFIIDEPGLVATYYSSDGDPVKALKTTATLNPAGDKLVFFLNDLKTGTQDLTKKTGTSANPGTRKITLGAGGGGGPVQTYVSYFNSGNTYFALSGFIEVKIDDSSIRVRWDIKFTDATGRVFESSGSFVFNFYTAVTKPKTDVTDPTPVADRPTIESISPIEGRSGDSVIINGTNYSTIIADDIVKFNGVAATVISATGTKMIVAAPQSGSTGIISVKVRNSETGNGPTFTYILPATITSVTPKNGKPGDIVTITGTNFSLTIAQNVVKFNGKAATVKTATATQLTVEVPQGATTGNLTLAVKGADAVSAGDFTIDAVVTPSDWTDVGFTGSIRDVNTSVSIATTNKMLFTGGPHSQYLYYTVDGLVYTSVYNKLPFDMSQSLTLNKLAADNGAFFITTSQGVAKSTNGINWTKLVPDAAKPMMSFTGILARRNTITLLSPPSPENKQTLYTSADGGTTWTKDNVTAPGIIDYITADANGKYYYGVDISNNFPGGDKIFYNSTNQGKTWNATTGRTGLYFYGNDYLDFLTSSGYTIFCQFNSNSNSTAPSDQRLYKTTNQGTSWTKISDEPSYVVKTKGDSEVIYGATSLNLSHDSGVTFKSHKLQDGYIMGGVEQTLDYTYIFAYKGSIHKIFRAKLQ
ncbi:MAG: IPT/TIG domain-containing protein, partial [Mucilaginibacter sp.]